jgi:hypothetical protein
MAYQFRPPHIDRNHSRPYPCVASSSTPFLPPNWREQQNFFMGANTSTYHSPISVSPQVSTMVSNFDTISPPYQAQLNDTSQVELYILCLHIIMATQVTIMTPYSIMSLTTYKEVQCTYLVQILTYMYITFHKL